MANYIGEQGLKVLAELRGYLESKQADKKELTQLVQQVPGSRSFFGFLKYQLLEKEADFAEQRERLATLVNQQIQNMRKVQAGENYAFVAKDADCLAYILNDLNSEKKNSGVFSRLKKYISEIFNRFMQPGGIKRYLAILLILALVVFSILSLISFFAFPLLHVGVVTSLLVSAALMYGLKKLSNMGQNSDDAHVEVFAGITVNDDNAPMPEAPTPDSTHEMQSSLGHENDTELTVGGESVDSDEAESEADEDRASKPGIFELPDEEHAAADDAPSARPGSPPK